MKVSKIVRQTKEYNRLQGLIQQIQLALDDIGKSKHLKPGQLPATGLFTLSESSIPIWSGGCMEYITISLNGDVINLIKADLEKILIKQLVALQEQQEALEA